MPIELYTGQPGNGKTALMMERLLDEAKRSERPIFAAGIDGLQPGLATVLDDPRKWNDHDPDGDPTCDCHGDGQLHAHRIPDGSLIFVDEAWKWFGHLHDARSQATPKHVLDLAEHRHRGLDFVWTTQQPNQLYPFVRGLIGSHSHVVRRFGTKMIDVFRWGELNEEVKSSAKRDNAQRTTRLLPSGAFGSYKSAEVHTIKPRVPFKVLALPAMVVAAAIFVFFAYRILKPDAYAERLKGSGTTAQAGVPASSTAAQGEQPRESRFKNATDYARQHLPRFGTMPWTAPIFDDRQVTADPQLVCMSSLGGADAYGNHSEPSCTCLTEQGTRYELSQPECRTLARYGSVYNPYRERHDEQRQDLHQLQQPVAQGRASITPGVSISRQERGQGTFPEFPSYQPSSW